MALRLVETPVRDGHRRRPPRQRRQQGDRGRRQPDADDPVGTAALAQGDVDDPGERRQQEQDHGERERHPAPVGRVEGGGLPAAQLVGGGQDRRAHELRRTAEVRLAERKPLTVQGPGRLDQARVDRQPGRDRRHRGAPGEPPGRVDEPVRGPGDVVVVAGPHRRRLAAARDVAAGRHRVGVGERAVELGGVRGEHRDAGLRLLHRRRPCQPAQHTEQGARHAADDEDGGDPAQPLGRGGARGGRPPPRGRGPDRHVDTHAAPPG